MIHSYIQSYEKRKAIGTTIPVIIAAMMVTTIAMSAMMVPIIHLFLSSIHLLFCKRESILCPFGLFGMCRPKYTLPSVKIFAIIQMATALLVAGATLDTTFGYLACIHQLILKRCSKH